MDIGGIGGINLIHTYPLLSLITGDFPDYSFKSAVNDAYSLICLELVVNGTANEPMTIIPGKESIHDLPPFPFVEWLP